jgi:hypothetical protein
MKAKNLRIGNIVDTINRSNKVHMPSQFPMKVFDINPFEVSLYNLAANPATIKKIPNFRIGDVCGIPLTDKWIQRLEFTIDPKSNLYYKDGVYLLNRLDGENEWIHDSHPTNTPLKYVHQLQNLYFALTGKELELKSDCVIPAVMGELTCDNCGCHPNVIYTTSKGRFCESCKPAS